MTLIHISTLDVQHGFESAFLDWYDGQFLPGLLERKDWAAARRYRCLDGEPSVLTIFELDVRDVDRATTLSAAPFRYETEGRRVRNYHGRSYRQIATLGKPRSASELINVVFTDVAPDHRAVFSRWYDEVHLPEIVNCPGWVAARRYESLGEEHRFVAMYDLEDAERPFTTPEFEAAVGWDEHTEHLLGYHGFRIYGLQRSLAVGSETPK